ncbi:MAG: SigB/SigF/SigG family RNA polymerase sigma factor [Sporichthyaceae bacterium]|nr:SigB/SigF/SigG family RNA polymerase sigma factor [Sporichthyaceae bacterium]
MPPGARRKPTRTKTAAKPARATRAAPEPPAAKPAAPAPPADAPPPDAAPPPAEAADAAKERGEFYVRRRATALRLLAEITTLAHDDPRRDELRTQVIEAHMPCARYLAARYGAPGEEVEDLFQVAYLALVKAVDNFDSDRGVAFLTYATPMIIGEIKRYFRDSTWAVHVPRRMQELSAQLRTATEVLGQSLGRSPTVGELAEHLIAEPAEIIDAMDARAAHSTVSLDLPVDAGSARPTPLQDLIGADDDSFDGVVNRETLKLLLAELSERDKQILLMRFFRGMTQSEIAAELGVSQMQVSRLLARILARLRAGMAAVRDSQSSHPPRLWITHVRLRSVGGGRA